MPPTLKESGNSQNAASAPRSAPVCLEVPVTVRGAVIDDQTNHSQSFSERTRTVLVFARGAVLRLAAPVTPGQTVILVNEHTKNEVRCEVLKSKAHAAGSGVIELEFSERSDNFWGMSFPGEKPARKPATIPAAQPAQESDGPAWPLEDRPLGVPPPVVNSYSGQADLAPFAETPKAPPAPAPAEHAAPVQESQAMPAWLENPEASSEPASVRFASAFAPALGSSQPAHDEPLDFNPAAESRKPKSEPLAQAAESDTVALPDFLKPSSSSRRPLPEIIHPPSATSTGARLLLRASLAVVIAFSLAGGGWYLWQRPGRAAWMSSLLAPKPADQAAHHAPLSSEPPQPLPPQTPGPLAASSPLSASTSYDSSAPLTARKSPEELSQPGFSLPAAAPGFSPTQSDSLHSSALSSAPVFSNPDNSSHLPIPPDAALATLASSPAEPVPAPTGSGPARTSQPSSAIPGSMAPVTSAALQETGKSPKPAGGLTRPARLIASVPPDFPLAARSQHISGDVVVDALIESTGHVGAMKIVSGNTLLRQAAMDALRKWRYQPALLNGEPVATHLQLTIQFRFRN
ncbi:MAG: TonB family protein [Acidobacteriia bacterium]|nr:TonB family protein [Terriglobia bacterium]